MIPLPSPYALLPFLALAKDRAERYLPDSLATATIILESTAIMQMTTTLCKNLLYITRSNDLKKNDLHNFLHSRIDYLALSLLCTANLVHSAMMTVLHAGLVLVTRGANVLMQHAFRKHYEHSLHCGLGIGIGLCGIVSPTLSAFLTSLVLQYLHHCLIAAWKRDFASFETSLLGETKKILHDNQKPITEFISAYLQDEYRYECMRPFLEEFIRELSGVQQFSELVELIALTLENCTNHL